MGVTVNFDYNAWVARYPEFSPTGAQPVVPSTAAAYFAEAGFFLDNNGTGPVEDSGMQLRLMNMLTAHIAALNNAALVGRITNASEGSVSVVVENSYESGSAQWYQQTKYGAAFWAATGQYRRMRYAPGPVMGVSARQGGFGFFPRFGRRF
jgi:hypothetical protein